MSAEIIYGVDFRAGKEEAPLCNAPDVLGVPSSQVIGHRQPDTAPPEYCPDDSGDCA